MAKRKTKRKVRTRTRKTARKTTRRAPQPRRARAVRARSAAKRSPARKPSRPAKKATARRIAQAPRPVARKKAVKPRSAGSARPKPVALQRERRRLTEDDFLPGAPSTLGYSPKASQAESGHESLLHKRRMHTEAGPELTGGDVDADWDEAYASGEEAPGGDNPTPDQDVVEEIGRALGVEYDDAEELKGAEKIEERDRHRWEYDPASADDYKDRNKKQ
jgi:Family of unknown function (DUF6335)